MQMQKAKHWEERAERGLKKKEEAMKRRADAMMEQGTVEEEEKSKVDVDSTLLSDDEDYDRMVRSDNGLEPTTSTPLVV